MITFCLISCERPDLLEITLDSFLKFNTAKIEKYIVSEDSAVRMVELEKKYPFIEFKYNDTGKRYGMMGNLQKAYSFAETEYIFSCEEDWQFYDYGFIEKSMNILHVRHNVLQVWLRERDDTNGHPIQYPAVTIGGEKCHYVTTGYMGCFHGYSTNPSLKRKCDVVDFSKIIEGCKNNGEDLVSQYYFDKGFRAVILNSGYVKHIGYNRTVI